MKSNELRISLAEWLYRMSEADVPYQARALAIYAVAFKVTANEELARLSGMDTRGLADKTYNKWKSYLSSHGWVIVKQVTVGRTRTIEITPALRETPVTFTDLVQRMPRKFYVPDTVESTVSDAVENTVEKVEVTAIPVEVTVSPAPPSRTRVEDNYINKTNTNSRGEKEDRGSGGKGKGQDLGLEDEQVSSIDLQALEAYNLYNEMALRCCLQQAVKLTPGRKKLIIARLKEFGAPAASGLEAWRIALSNIEKSAYLRGSGGGRPGWKADLDFLVQASRFTKVVEGGYGNGAHADAAQAETKVERYARIIAEMNNQNQGQEHS